MIKQQWHEDWQKISVHDAENVKGFFGDFRWLSNFHLSPVEFEGVVYPSSENAYQAAKVAPNQRSEFITCTPARSKKLWKEIGTIWLPNDWDKMKFFVMQKVLFDKFLRNDGLRSALLLTGNKYLEELNWWSDVCWGVDYRTGKGENHLGKQLMAVRAYFQRYPLDK